ncbi:helix-turn-helix domain-containing protein [Glycomyces sp. NPDC048151]|uniref:helix-turn-helix domain-containing protein n=1 Tax=Glycomyces sp. NPDC048151 TaxID=3364002 RepID=UPI0037227A18
MSTSSMLRRQVGRELETMRLAAGVPLSDKGAAEIVGSTRTLKRLESGERVRLTYPVIGGLCDFYGAPSQRRFELQRIWQLVDERTWSQPSHAVVASGFDAYVEFERIATRFDLYETVFIPGQFQTEHYMVRSFQNNPLIERSQIAKLVERRLGRQEVLEARNPAPELRVLMSEAALRYGCEEEQIQRLLEEDAKPNVTIRYVPFDGGPPHELSAPFHVLSFSDSADPNVVYLESPYERRFYENREVVAHYLRIIDAGDQRARSMREFEQ